MPFREFTNRLPNLKHLQYLIALYKYQHFNKAAQGCFVSQSTLSSAIVKLEQQLECNLIEREHKSFMFTPQGESVVKMAKQLLLGANELVDYAKQQGSPNSGSMRIGCIPTIAPFLLTDLIQHCQINLPSIDLFLREDTTENIMLMLSQGEIDVAILALPVAPHNFSVEILGTDDFYIAGDKKLITSFQQNHDYQNLPKQSVFLLNQEHCLTEHAVSACKLADPSRIHPFSASSLATLVQMTSFHQGITFLPKMAVDKGLGKAEGLVIEKMDGEVYREIGLLWRPASMRISMFSKLANIITDLLSKQS